MEEGVKGVIAGLVVVVAALFFIFICYGLIYVWVRECIDYYIRGAAINNNKSMDLSTRTGDDEESSLPPSGRRFGNLFLLPCALAFPLATWLCIARNMEEYNNKLFALSCVASLFFINYYCLSSLYVQSAKWLVSRCYKYNSCFSRQAVKFIILGLITAGAAEVQNSVEGHAIMAALTVTVMSVIAYTWKEDASGITNGIALGYVLLQYLGNQLWYQETELRRILVVPLIFSFFAMFTETADEFIAIFTENPSQQSG